MSLVVNEHGGVWSIEDQLTLIPWLKAHGVEPKDVPVDTTFDFDLSTTPWRCTVSRYVRNDTGGFVVVGGRVLRKPARFKVRIPFPLSAEVMP